MSREQAEDERRRQFWDRHAPTYDRQMQWAERHLADVRPWLCRRAVGETLEVAIGTGLNLEHYASDLPLTGVEWSAPMLAQAAQRATVLGRSATLLVADARELPCDDARFDTVVSTFALCSIPEPDRALAEMVRVLRPGGLLLLADHIESSAWPVRVLQRLVDLASVPLQGERYCHRPLRTVLAMGLTIEEQERRGLGMIERLVARKPST